MIFTYILFNSVLAEKEILLPKGSVVRVEKDSMFCLQYEFSVINNVQKDLNGLYNSDKKMIIGKNVDHDIVCLKNNAGENKKLLISTYAFFPRNVPLKMGNKTYVYRPKKDSYNYLLTDKNAFYFNLQPDCMYEIVEKYHADFKAFLFPIFNGSNKKNVLSKIKNIIIPKKRKNKDRILYFDTFMPMFTVKNEFTKVGTNFTIKQDDLCRINVKKKLINNVVRKEKMKAYEKEFVMKKLSEYKCLYLKFDFLSKLANDFDGKIGFRTTMKFCADEQEVKLLNDCYVTEISLNNLNNLNNKNNPEKKKTGNFIIGFVSLLTISCIGVVLFCFIKLRKESSEKVELIK
ncbi:hypothetical protein EHP00_810 [Ecytonucleospora hepatopenaei]|uniref:Transmembrane protein n=1 Tax=Ecytonucleospora hepatopenaei TaxID=646526 RepID=A0A1W0E7V7_9MICR|nr:hypothetical protein EHP00_810 [Ecytonucleospora hepatopenaei]